jgi:hypothetical protein
MKKPALYGMITACAWSFSGPILAQEKKPDAAQGEVPQVRVQVELIDVSHEQLTKLMFGDKPAANDRDLRKQVAQLVKDGKATVAETMLCVTRSGQKATTESIEEYIYPTEYEPAEISIESSSKEKNSTEPTKETVRDNATGPTPTAFETRNLGSTIEIEPTLSADQKTVDLRLVPEMVHHVRNQVWAEWKGEHGNSPIQMPIMYTVRVNTAVTLATGRYMLLAALSPKNKDGFPDYTRKLMVFVKADLATPGR